MSFHDLVQVTPWTEQAQVRALAQVRVLVRVLARARALAQAQAQALEADTEAEGLALGRALARVLALALVHFSRPGPFAEGIVARTLSQDVKGSSHSEPLTRSWKLPEHLVNRGLQRCSDAVVSRLRTFRIKSPCEMSPLLNYFLRIPGTAASEELTAVEIKPRKCDIIPRSNILLHLPFHHCALSCHAGLRSPIDLLSLPIYHNDINLLFVHTLRHLTLRAVSIQWVSVRAFHVLEICALLFPLHHQILPTLNTNLPNCKCLTFQGYPLNILDGISVHTHTVFRNMPLFL